MKKATALILALILISALLLTGCGGKDGSSSTEPDPMANVSKEDVAVQAMVAYYSGDLKSYLPVYVPEYETALRMEIAGYDYSDKDNRDEFLQKAKEVTQEQLDEWAAKYFTQKEALYGVSGTYKVTAEAKDTREVKDREEFIEDIFTGEHYDGTYSKFTDFLSESQIQDVARVKVRVEFENVEDPSDGFGSTLEVKLVKINGAWKVVTFNLASW